MNPDELLSILGNLFSPASAEAATGPTFEQKQQLEQQKAAQALQLLMEKLRLQQQQQAQDPLRQAQVANTQATTQKTQAGLAPQHSLIDILGSSGSGDNVSPEGSGTAIYGYGGGVQPTMESSNDRIRLILDALQQGEAPPGQDPNIGPQAASDFTPVNPQPGQPFRFKGYEDTGFNPTTRAFTNVGLPPDTSKPTPIVDSSQMTPQEQQKMADYSALLEHQKVPADIRTKMIEQQFPKVKIQQEKEKKALFQYQKQVQHDLSPAKPGIYLDAKGNPIQTPMLFGDIPKDTSFYQQGSPQAKVYGASGQVNSHVDRTLEHLQAVSKIDSSRFQRYLTTNLKYFNNDPDIVALKNFLSPASAGAVMNSYAATSVGMRGGATLIQIFKDAVYTEGDDLRSVLTKLKDLELVNKAGAEHTGLHPAVIQAAQDRINVIDKLMGKVDTANKTKPKIAQAPVLTPTTSGQIIQRTGTTQQYRLLPGAQLPEGYEVVQ